MRDAAFRPCRIDLVAGTRPNLVKLAPLASALSSQPWCQLDVIFIEQHSAQALSTDVMADLGIDAGKVHRIPIDQHGHGQRLGEMVTRYGARARCRSPDLVVVFGDVDATLAVAIAAKREGHLLAHVEAGLRSRDRRMPEELNRLMVDSIADMFFTTTAEASATLRNEGHAPDQIHLVGNLMIDSLYRSLDLDAGRQRVARFGLAPGEFIVATFHRPSNVDQPRALCDVVSLLEQVTNRMPVLLPLHPRTKAALDRHGLRGRIEAIPGLHLTQSLRYKEFISLVGHARLAITDSGGLQEETTVLGIPCLTFRENTERPETITRGTNRLVDMEGISTALEHILGSPPPRRPVIPLWDGHCATRIVRTLQQWWSQ